MKSEPALRRCKIIATCRTETWARYLQQIGNDRPLDPAIFLTRGGDVVRVGGFTDAALRAQLYAAYQRRYRLNPQSYAALSEPIRELIAHPLLMALIAEGYANAEDADLAQRLEVPRELDYFTLFRKLTDRKSDAQVLVPASERLERERLPAAIEELCEKLAAMIYERLIVEDVATVDSSNREFAAAGHGRQATRAAALCPRRLYHGAGGRAAGRPARPDSASRCAMPAAG